MAVQFSAAVRNARAQAHEDAIGVSPKLEYRTGAMPANVAAATTGTRLALFQLPSDWLGAPSAGAQAKAGTWEDLAADAAGLIGYYRIFAADGTTCHEQGTVTLTGLGGDMTVDNPVVEAGQKITVTSYVMTEGNA